MFISQVFHLNVLLVQVKLIEAHRKEDSDMVQHPHVPSLKRFEIVGVVKCQCSKAQIS